MEHDSLFYLGSKEPCLWFDNTNVKAIGPSYLFPSFPPWF